MSEPKPERIDELRRRFRNEWLLIKVTKHDKNGLPLEGVLLFHSPDRKAVWAHSESEEGELYVFFAGPIVPEGREVVLGGVRIL